MSTDTETHSEVSAQLLLQHLPGPLRVLATGRLAAGRNEDDAFTTAQVVALFRDLRLPPMANVSSALRRLREQRKVMQPDNGKWTLTPLGEAELHEKTAHISLATLNAAPRGMPGTDFGHQRHALIPPFLGPIGMNSGLTKLLDKSPFDQNVMLITRFPQGPGDHLTTLIPLISQAVKAHGLTLHMASDGNSEDTLWANVTAYMWACRYAIALVDWVDGRHNANVLIEIGGMLMTGRRCAILRDEAVPNMPSDLVGHIYKSVSLTEHMTSVTAVHRWIRDDLKLSECETCPAAA